MKDRFERERDKRKSILGYKSMALAVFLAAGATAHDAVRPGTKEASVAERYDETIRREKVAYKHRKDKNETFDTFLEQRDIPTPAEVEALERLIAEFDAPVKIRSGFSIVHAIALRSSIGVYTPLESKFTGKLVHNIFIPHKDSLDREFMRTVIAELAHAYQREADTPALKLKRKKMIDIRKFVDTITDSMTPYRTPGNVEYEAHELIEPELHRKYASLREDYRAYMRSSITDFSEGKDIKPIYKFITKTDPKSIEAVSAETFTFEKFKTLLETIERNTDTAQDSRVNEYDAILIARAMEDYLPSFEAEITRTKDKGYTVHIVPSQKLYEELVAFINDYKRPEKGIGGTVPLSPGVNDHTTLNTFDKYRQAARSYDYAKNGFFWDYVNSQIPGTEIEAIREEAKKSGDSYEWRHSQLHDEYEEKLLTHEYTFEDYTALAKRITAVAKLQEEKRKEGKEDPYGNDEEPGSQVFNEACHFETTCGDMPYGVQVLPLSGTLQTVISKNADGAHFKTIKRIYDESRAQKIEQRKTYATISGPDKK